jgi:hypothetical protein
MKKSFGWGLSTTLVLVMAGVGCGMDAASDSSGSAPSNGPTNGTGGQGSGTAGTGTSAPGNNSAGSTSFAGTGGGGGAPIIVVPPEKELEESFLAPVVTGKYVFSANPKSGRVAVIDAETYGVKLFNAGFGPTYLAAIPGNHGAIVINDLSHDTTLFDVVGDEVKVVDASLPVHTDANAWAVSPDGRFAIAWTRTAGDYNKRGEAGTASFLVQKLP